ncbi:MAG: DUF5667 domain-containing protein [Patescibacteria group bacterium]|nr:DUF5667 domain-containing protein [Patescibacteria group bacterium]
MKNIFKLLRRKMSLTDSERQALRYSVLEFMRQNPPSQHATVLSGINERWAFFRAMLRHGYALTAVIALLLIGGTSWAAETALPGDLLYPVKIAVNENVRTALTLTPEAKAEWSSQQALRRLREAEQLAIQGRLNQQVQTELAQRFTASVQSANQKAAQLAANGQTQTAAEVNSHFEATLRAHRTILNDLEKHPTPEQAQVNNLATSVNAALAATENDRKKSEAEVVGGAVPNVKSAAEDTQHTAERKISEVQTYMQPRLETMNPTARQDTTEDVSAARHSVTEGEKNLAEKKYGDAFTQFQNAQRIAQETKTIMQERDFLGIKPSDTHPDGNSQDGTLKDRRDESQPKDSAPTSTSEIIQPQDNGTATTTEQFNRGDRKMNPLPQPTAVERRNDTQDTSEKQGRETSNRKQDNNREE